MRLFKWGSFFILVMIAAMIAPQASAVFENVDHVVINTMDWQEIYSAMFYSSLQSLSSDYIIEESRGYLLLETLDKNKENILLFESPANPYLRNFDNDLESKGFQVQKYTGYSNLNLDIALELEGIKRFIIIDPRYSYNAVSVAPYAILGGYYVLFADNEKISDIVGFLDSVEPEEIIIYGYVDREVTDALERFSPETINLGNRYENNIEIVKKFEETREFSQYILTNGKFIEPQFFTTTSPIVFIGNSNIPETTMEYLKGADVKHAILIGNEIVDNALTLKSEAGMKIMVKFAKGINKVQYSLDTIYLPESSFEPVFREISYNPLSNQLVVVIENTGDSPLMTRATYTILYNNESVASLSDDSAYFIGGNSITTRTYDVNLSEYGDWGFKVSARMLYGEDTGSLDNLLIDERDLEIISFDDRSKIEVVGIYYDTSIKRFILTIKNIGDKPVYVLPQIIDIMINNKLESLTGELTIIEPGDKQKLKIKARLSPEDFEDNSMISLRIQYGDNEDRLVKRREIETEFKKHNYRNNIYIGAGAALLLGIILAVVLGRRRKHNKRRKRQSFDNHETARSHNNKNIPPPPKRDY
ncbi:hypothetical protein JXB31_01410 [Candidatus Woesearchaeota archaeon]|nr:hypothetical protein [Candidatus Woesearchaeota archaeon]